MQNNDFLGLLLIVDNGTREGLEKFLKAASSDPDTVLHYEFMQDYKVLFYFFPQQSYINFTSLFDVVIGKDSSFLH